MYRVHKGPLQPDVSDVHVDRPLTDLSIAYLQDDDAFIASRVAPTIPVAKQADKYFTFDRAYFYSDEVQKRSPGTESQGGGYNISTGTYYCQEYALHKDIPREVIANADNPLDPRRNALQYLTLKHKIKKERHFASNLFTTGVYTTNLTGNSSAGASQVVYWNDTSNATPIKDVREGMTTVKQLTGYTPNVMVMSLDVFNAVLDLDDIIDRIKYGQTPGEPAMANKQALAKLFGVSRIEVMAGVYNTALEGATESNAFISSGKAGLFYIPDSPGIEVPSAFYNFAWTGLDSQYGNMGFAIDEYEMQNLKSTRLDSSMYFDMKLISADLGYFWSGLLQ